MIITWKVQTENRQERTLGSGRLLESMFLMFDSVLQHLFYSLHKNSQLNTFGLPSDLFIFKMPNCTTQPPSGSLALNPTKPRPFHMGGFNLLYTLNALKYANFELCRTSRTSLLTKSMTISGQTKQTRRNNKTLVDNRANFDLVHSLNWGLQPKRFRDVVFNLPC